MDSLCELLDFANLHLFLQTNQKESGFMLENFNQFICGEYAAGCSMVSGLAELP
jgi:hypothetical protein